MQSIIDAITEWIKKMLISGIIGNLTGMYETVNSRVGEIASEVGKTPSQWNGGVFSLIQNLSETVVLPIAGIILTFVMCYELISMIIDKSHYHNHIIWNSTNINCDRKFRNFWNSTRAVRKINDLICLQNGLSIVENPKKNLKIMVVG